MLCDQASDKIFFIYQTTSHLPLVIFYNRIDRLSTARVKINPSPLLLIALVYLPHPTLRGPVYQCEP